MKRNTASQVVGAQLNSKTDGSAVTSGTTTAYVLGDGGTQSAGSVGSGACTHEGNGFWTYAPAQAETDYAHVAFTFVNTAAVNATVQIYPSFPQTGDGFARLGAPAGASVSADVAATKALLPTALVGGRMDSSVGAMASGVLTATAIAADAITAAKVADGTIDAATFAAGAINAAAIAADAITDAKVASDVTIASVTGAVGSVTGNVGGNVTGSVGSVSGNVGGNVVGSVASVSGNVGGTVASVVGNVGGNVTGSVGSIASGGIVAASFAADSITAAKLAADVTTELQAGLSTLTAAGVRSAVGLASANLDTQLAGISAPSAAAVADAVWDEVLSGHAGAGSAGAGLTAAGSAGDPWATPLPGAYGSGTAGKIIGDNVNATISSRLASGSYAAPLDAAGVRAAVGLASANLDTQIDALPTNAELATALGTADDAVLAQVALVKAKTDLIPSDPADASDIAGAFGTVNSTLATIAGYIDTEIATLVTRVGTPAGASLSADLAAAKVVADAIKAKTDNLPVDPAGVTSLLNTAFAESYATAGANPTLKQLIFMVWATLANRDIIGDTLTARKLDGTTVAMTFDLDSGSAPTSQVRAT